MLFFFPFQIHGSVEICTHPDNYFYNCKYTATTCSFLTNEIQIPKNSPRVLEIVLNGNRIFS